MVFTGEIQSEKKMTVQVPDRFKAANAFWIGLAKIGLTPAAVLTHARLPLTVYDGKKNFVTTAQFFALWRAVGELSADPAAGLKIATQIDVGNRPPSTMAAYYARDYRDALTVVAGFDSDLDQRAALVNRSARVEGQGKVFHSHGIADLARVLSLPLDRVIAQRI